MEPKTNPIVPLDWLLKKMTEQEIREAWQNTESKLGISISAAWLRKWKEFLSTCSDTDELWFFRSDEESWHDFSGVEGYAIVRDGKPISKIISAKS